MDGIINVYKEKGYTSHDVVAILRGILKTRKIGHTGTLDPDAEGVLPICVGKATKVADAIMGSEKVYEAALRFGCETDTQDASGEVTQTYQYEFCQGDAMGAISSFIGEYEQIPPMYSAVKVGGIKLYELARQGVEVDRKPRRVAIHDIQVLSLHESGAVIRVRCSKGTYIRTLCEDIGRRLGYGAHMERLVRLQSGRFAREDSCTLDQIERHMREGHPEAFLQPLDRFFDELRRRDRRAGAGWNAQKWKSPAASPAGRGESGGIAANVHIRASVYRAVQDRGCVCPGDPGKTL